MNADTVLDRIIQANPKPASAEAPGKILTRSALLVELDRRSGDMQTQDKPISIEQPKLPRPPRSRRLVVALAGATALVVAVVMAVVFTSDGQPPSQYADAAATGDARAVLGVFAESYRTGDVETALKYVDPEMTITSMARHPGFEWLPGLIEFEGVLYGRDEPGPSVCEGPNENGFVLCTFTESPDSLLVAAGLPEVTWAAQVVDGRIGNLQFPGGRVGEVITPVVRDVFERLLGEYAEGIDPEGTATQCDLLAAFEVNDNLFAPVVFNEQCATFLTGFLDGYAATLGG